MRAEEAFQPFTRAELQYYGTPRSGETRLWERIHLLEGGKEWELDPSHPAAFVVIGIPEDIGPRANRGQGGADEAWESFLGKFLNIQDNRFGIAERTILGGKVHTEDLQERAEGLDPSSDEEVAELRKLSSELDDRVIPVIRKIVRAGKCPIVIGGGHNNAYGNLRGCCDALRELVELEADEGMSCLNVDPHADLRETEGRHSGNGFTYAMEEGYLSHYAICGLHRNYNPESILQRFDRAPERFHVSYFEDMLREDEQDRALDASLSFLEEVGRPFGLEIDLDSIAGMAVSAETPSGFHENAVRRFIQTVRQKEGLAYIHLAEGAPKNRPGYEGHVGKFLAYLVSDAIREGSDRV